MAINIRTNGFYGHLGDGVPTFVAPRGGTFLDLLEPAIYQSNGDGTWVDYNNPSNSNNFYTTAATFSNNVLYFDRTDSLSAYTVNISGLSTDIYVTATTFNSGNYDLTLHRNDATNLTESLAILASDMVVTGGTYDINTGIVTYTNNSGGTFNISGFTSGMTDTYTDEASLSGSSIIFDSNINGANVYNVDLTPLLSGKTNVSLFNSHTGDTTIHFTKASLDSIFVNITGDTMTGGLIAPSVSATTISAGTLDVASTVNFASMTGSTDRLAEVGTGGTVSATRDIIEAYIASGGLIASYLDTTSFWTIDGGYTGTSITNTYQGQRHYNVDYFFEAVDDNLWVRLIRG